MSTMNELRLYLFFSLELLTLIIHTFCRVGKTYTEKERARSIRLETRKEGMSKLNLRNVFENFLDENITDRVFEEMLLKDI